MIGIYIEVEDGVRLERALKREQQQASPKYAEMCRRFLADQDDFPKKNWNRQDRRRFAMWNLKHAWKKSAGSLFQIRTGNGCTEKDKRQKTRT